MKQVKNKELKDCAHGQTRNKVYIYCLDENASFNI